MEEQVPVQEVPVEVPEQETEETKEEETIQPTKTIKNFWERLDEVFALNVENAKMRQQVEELLDAFPAEERARRGLNSFIFQPERISLNSNNDINRFKRDFITPSYGTENFSEFRIRLLRPALGVTSTQLLRASIPTPVTNIPDTQTMFFYYRIGNTGAPDYAPDYTQVDVAHMKMIRLLPSQIFNPKNYTNPYIYGFNRTFQDYQDLVTELNKSCVNDPDQALPNFNQFYTANDIQFQYDPVYNKIRMIPTLYANGAVFPPAANLQYYIIAGYEDPNIAVFIAAMRALNVIPTNYQLAPGYNLNTRLGWSWDGLFLNSSDPNDPVFQVDVANHMNPSPEFNGAGWTEFLPYSYANTYANLVNTACVYVYLDFIGGSSEDSTGQQGLLGVVPASSANNQVSFYQNTISNPLTKIPQYIFELGIRLVDDNGDPFYVPNSAIVNIEIGFGYK